MRFAKENTAFLVIFIIIGALFCSALGVFLAELVPALAKMKKSLVSVGFDLEFIALTLRFNVMSLVGIVAGVLIFAKA
ncbi:MAG: hypothetical protein ACOC2H_03225 [Spirochaetota bacterium]